jgi:mediator of RNA polymerase II transcription subunit 22
MKLLLLLSDETQIANRRDAELKLVRSETDATKKEVEALLDDLLGKTGE